MCDLQLMILYGHYNDENNNDMTQMNEASVVVTKYSSTVTPTNSLSLTTFYTEHTEDNEYMSEVRGLIWKKKNMLKIKTCFVVLF